ncbi:MAG TPA: methylated-DNA--[protein]-cysteine S-methyltransferase [Fulvivirga sp.]|nr:methylated-DNA--[protein]-cysteine S-methyltransferase [Fulvivirga sp.]
MEQLIYHSPIGPLAIYSSEEAIVEIRFDGHLESEKSSSIIEQCVQQLDEYFEGKRENFELKLNPTGTDFQLRVWKELQNIPFGKTCSYSEMAIKLGDIKVIRAAGTANGKNKIPIIIPCHRVIGKDGSLVGFGGGLDRKEWLLQHEGILKGEQMKIFG